MHDALPMTYVVGVNPGNWAWSFRQWLITQLEVSIKRPERQKDRNWHVGPVLTPLARLTKINHDDKLLEHYKRRVGWPSIEEDLQWKKSFNGKSPSMKDGLQWKMAFNGRQPSMEDKLQWKTTFNGRRISMEDILWWKMVFDERWPSMEDDLWWQTTFDGGWPSMGEDPQWKTTFNGRQP